MSLADYGGRILTIDGSRVLEMRDLNDNARRRYQYRRAGSGIERRVLASDGEPFRDTGSPWERLTDAEIAAMHGVRGAYHPILDEL